MYFLGQVACYVFIAIVIAALLTYKHYNIEHSKKVIGVESMAFLLCFMTEVNYILLPYLTPEPAEDTAIKTDHKTDYTGRA